MAKLVPCPICKSPVESPVKGPEKGPSQKCPFCHFWLFNCRKCKALLSGPTQTEQVTIENPDYKLAMKNYRIYVDRAQRDGLVVTHEPPEQTLTVSRWIPCLQCGEVDPLGTIRKYGDPYGLYRGKKAVPVSTPVPAVPVSTPVQKMILSPTDEQVITQLQAEGQRYLNARHYDLALPIYEQILYIDPTDHHAYFNKGICLAARGSHDLALAAFEQACYLNPMDALYHFTRGDELFELYRFQEALQAFEQCLQMNLRWGRIVTVKHGE